MKFSITLVSVIYATVAVAYPSHQNLPRDHPPVGVWQQPGEGDVRGPCPALNSLANSGHIPRNGRKITFNHIVRGFVDVLGLSEGVSKTLAAGAMALGNDADAPEAEDLTPPHLAGADHEIDDDADKGPGFIMKNIGKLKTPFGVRNKNDYDQYGNPTLDLDALRKHNKIEHDVSLVRMDYNLSPTNDNWRVNQELFEQFLAQSSDGEYITVHELGRWRGLRFKDSKSRNPAFRFEKQDQTLAFGEAAVLAGLLGDPKREYALPISVIKSFLGNDKLPTPQEGWTKRPNGKEMGFFDTFRIVSKLKKAAKETSTKRR